MTQNRGDMNFPPAGTLGALLRLAKQRLGEAGVEDPGLEARLLVEHFTATTRTDAIASPERPVDAEAVRKVEAAIGRRIAGEPVHRILGWREFYGLKLTLSPATLEPRPDTETLVDLVLPDARRIAAIRGRCRILDLGTGTGAIALALLSLVPEAEAVGTDISQEALETARRNAEINGYAARFDVLKSSWLDSVDGLFDLVLSNPPYIATEEIKTLEPSVREHDPVASLDGGPDGLEAYRAIAAGAHCHLTAGGLVGVETGHDQKAAVAAIFASHGYRTVKTARDLGGRDRAMVFALAQGG